MSFQNNSFIEGALKRADIPASTVDACYMGNVLSAGIGQAPARQAALGAGLPTSCPCTTVNKVCASGLKAVTLAANDIALGHADVVVAGGMESMSQVPHYVQGVRFGDLRMGNGALIDGALHDGLFDPHNGQHMGMCAEACASEHSITRAAQDAYAKESYTRSIGAWERELFDSEIEPVPLPSKKKRGGKPAQTSKAKSNGDVNVEFVNRDEECFRYSVDGLPNLRPVFVKDETGTVTTGNASGLSDGAAALILMSEDKATELGVRPIARVVSFADAATEPVKFTVAPSIAIPKALRRAALTVDDIDVFEINEAFSVVAEANMKILGLPREHVNEWGGAVGMGHPIGCSGARILVTLLNVMEKRNCRRGVAAVCNGGGGATALVVERGPLQSSPL